MLDNDLPSAPASRTACGKEVRVEGLVGRRHSYSNLVDVR
jgi:hypothetical protein